MTTVQRLLLATVLFTVAAGSSAGRAIAGDIQVHADDSMKYDLTSIEGQTGETLHITLTNTGKAPKTGMAHNIVILAPGTDWKSFCTAAATQSANGYLPAAEADHILTNTKMLGPGESDSLDFTPKSAGTYEYVCTFPAHALLGMRGTITVK